MTTPAGARLTLTEDTDRAPDCPVPSRRAPAGGATRLPGPSRAPASTFTPMRYGGTGNEVRSRPPTRA